MSASIPVPRASRRQKKISTPLALTRIILIVGATVGSLILAVRLSSSNACADVVCRLDTSHGTTGLAVIGAVPSAKIKQSAHKQ